MRTLPPGGTDMASSVRLARRTLPPGGSVLTFQFSRQSVQLGIQCAHLGAFLSGRHWYIGDVYIHTSVSVVNGLGVQCSKRNGHPWLMFEQHAGMPPSAFIAGCAPAAQATMRQALPRQRRLTPSTLSGQVLNRLKAHADIGAPDF